MLNEKEIYVFFFQNVNILYSKLDIFQGELRNEKCFSKCIKKISLKMLVSSRQTNNGNKKKQYLFLKTNLT